MSARLSKRVISLAELGMKPGSVAAAPKLWHTAQRARAFMAPLAPARGAPEDRGNWETLQETGTGREEPQPHTPPDYCCRNKNSTENGEAGWGRGSHTQHKGMGEERSIPGGPGTNTSTTSPRTKAIVIKSSRVEWRVSGGMERRGKIVRSSTEEDGGEKDIGRL